MNERTQTEREQVLDGTVSVREGGAAVDTSFVTRANLDGSDFEVVVSCSTVCGIGEFAIDTLANKIYYDNPGFDRIARANLDGTDEQEVIPLGGASVATMAINVPERKLYWSDSTSIQRLYLDGTRTERPLSNRAVSGEGPSSRRAAQGTLQHQDPLRRRLVGG